MKNVLIAIGGTGVKVAEVFVKQLMVGFPTHENSQEIQKGKSQINTSFEIWRIDSDRNSASVSSLKKVIADYLRLRSILSKDLSSGDDWFVDLHSEVKDLDPTEFLAADGSQVHAKTLRHVLDSRSMTADSSSEILSAFFSKDELDLNLEKGFSQQTSIGAAVMSVFVESLNNPNSPAGSKVRIEEYLDEPTRFLVCGSVFGATGASGLVAVTNFLNKFRSGNRRANWLVGAVGVTPFFRPPSAPVAPVSIGDNSEDSNVDELLRLYGNSPAFVDMSLEEKSDSVKRIINNLFANPEFFENKALGTLAYISEKIGEAVDHIYLVGSDRQIELPRWSIGGSTQIQPYTNTHAVAALSVLSFFTRTDARTKGSFNIPSSKNQYRGANLRSFDLPHYQIGDQEIRSEKVLFATALTVHLIKNRIPWGKMREAGSILRLARIYQKEGFEAESEYRAFVEACDILRTCMWTLVDADSPDRPTGWDLSEWSNLEQIMSDDLTISMKFGESFERQRFTGQPRGRVEHGETEGEFTDFDFARWCPDERNFSRANYLRAVWKGVFNHLSD